MEFSEEPIKFYQGIDGKTCWMVGGQVMATGCYQYLMKYYFNIEAFTKEEIKENVGVIRRLTFKPDNYR